VRAAFGYRRPDSLRQVFQLLASHPDACLLAGGTDVAIGLRTGTLAPGVLIDLKRVAELRPAISVTGERVRIASGTVLADIAADPVLRDRFPALVEAVLTVGSVQIRHRATLTGNVCHASPAADTAPALLAYGAELVLASAAGTRRLPVRDFFRGPGRTALRPGEVAVAIELLPPGCPSGAAFARLTRRRGVDLATVSVCCAVAPDGVTRFGYGAVAPTPLLVEDATATLADPGADPGRRDEVLAALVSRASPISDVRAGREYRQAMLTVLSRRALRTALARAGTGDREDGVNR
jgi:carbon-monoxide dehydrogenase medium subunit